ncbi:hypothetical protein CXQ85_003340 [Candidozyma haemuli]|uniref:WW domain-containing protein n=1 Tax=Candidozyma haemuli TaxID=45357 RepID=A0A2V1AP64_9ASCO|nr:hypothetical protein CXQ85_003340 [[Candida] haemuloni]PVH19494.1 hypothetical protein CXQ85_003340 [[Candida] haemuloni]
MWQQKYDEGLQMPYYVNLDDGSITFDLPCEVSVQKKPSKCKENIIQRITSALSLRRSSSKNSDDGCQVKQDEASEETYITADTSPPSTPQMKYEEEPSSPLSLSGMPNESYMLEKAFNLYPNENDVASISSDESIQSFYSDIVANSVYYDYARSVYCDEKPPIEEDSDLQRENAFFNDDYEKELERQELRLQIMKELY